MNGNADAAVRSRQAMNNALNRAYAQAKLGNLPALVATEILPDALREQYRVASRTIDGQVYLVDLMVDRRGVISTHCECQAALAGKCCFHRGLARLAHCDAIPLVNEVGYRLRPRRQQPAITAAFLRGKA